MRYRYIDKYTTAEYVIFDIYFPKTHQSVPVITCIIKKIYIMDNDLKIKIFIKINVFGPEKIEYLYF